MSVEKRVTAYLELATKDVEAAELLVAGGNRYAAYHVQQAVEKLTKAALLAKGIEHRLEELFKRFAEGDPWPGRLHPLASYSAYATAFRYPTPGGRIPGDPPADTIRRDLTTIRDLIATARTELRTGP